MSSFSRPLPAHLGNHLMPTLLPTTSTSSISTTSLQHFSFDKFDQNENNNNNEYVVPLEEDYYTEQIHQKINNPYEDHDSSANSLFNHDRPSSITSQPQVRVKKVKKISEQTKIKRKDQALRRIGCQQYLMAMIKNKATPNSPPPWCSFKLSDEETDALVLEYETLYLGILDLLAQLPQPQVHEGNKTTKKPVRIKFKASNNQEIVSEDDQEINKSVLFVKTAEEESESETWSHSEKSADIDKSLEEKVRDEFPPNKQHRSPVVLPYPSNNQKRITSETVPIILRLSLDSPTDIPDLQVEEHRKSSSNETFKSPKTEFTQDNHSEYDVPILEKKNSKTRKSNKTQMQPHSINIDGEIADEIRSKKKIPKLVKKSHNNDQSDGKIVSPTSHPEMSPSSPQAQTQTLAQTPSQNWTQNESISPHPQPLLPSSISAPVSLDTVLAKRVRKGTRKVFKSRYNTESLRKEAAEREFDDTSAVEEKGTGNTKESPNSNLASDSNLNQSKFVASKSPENKPFSPNLMSELQNKLANKKQTQKKKVQNPQEDELQSSNSNEEKKQIKDQRNVALKQDEHPPPSQQQQLELQTQQQEEPDKDQSTETEIKESDGLVKKKGGFFSLFKRKKSAA